MRIHESSDRRHDDFGSTWSRADETTMLWRELELTFGTRNAAEITHRLRLLRAALGDVARRETP